MTPSVSTPIKAYRARVSIIRPHTPEGQVVA
jgi:hypothetical protein